VTREAFFARARELDSRQTAADARCVFQRTRLLRAEGEKYPLMRVEESLRMDPAGRAEPRFLTRVAMVADHVMVKLPPDLDRASAEALAAQYSARVRSHLRARTVSPTLVKPCGWP
jgi:hypothetical protein